MSDAPSDPLADPAATVARHPHLRHAPAATRNRAPIRQALAEILPATPCTVLEIASGTGEHALWMARAMPHVIWQPTEATIEGSDAINNWRALCPDRPCHEAANCHRHQIHRDPDRIHLP
ncbi:DUF938 domain-containing protein [Roseinatronobacter sp.]|uniref:DUF938 domain-containing protein n=1 Tax=Roseinatronobacter sp. TaxID=1945755 RepID=UPI0025F70273|nr:DUF938 domain-containing protein [Roseibaca sp.]